MVTITRSHLGRFFVLLFALVWMGCGPTALITPTKIPTVAVSSAKVPTVKPVDQTLPGFSAIEVVPDDVLLAAKPAPANVIQSLLVSVGAGGFCADESKPNVDGYRDSSMSFKFSLCGYPPGEKVNIRLIGPIDPSFSETAPIDGDGSYDRCIDPIFTLLPGPYQVSIQSASGTQTASFQVQDKPDDPRVFLSRSVQSPYRLRLSAPGCWGSIVEHNPILILYLGFRPNEIVQTILYYSSTYANFDYLTSWPAKMDGDGRLAQQIQSPELFKEGEYLIIAIGQKLRNPELGSNFGTNLPDMKVSAEYLFWGTKTK